MIKNVTIKQTGLTHFSKPFFEESKRVICNKRDGIYGIS